MPSFGYSSGFIGMSLKAFSMSVFAACAPGGHSCISLMASRTQQYLTCLHSFGMFELIEDSLYGKDRSCTY